MRLLLDECVPLGMVSVLGSPSEEVQIEHVVRLGWSGLKNGALLQRLVNDGFSGLVTTDRNLVHQQQVVGLGAFVIVIVAPTNRLVDLAPFAAKVLRAAQSARAGEVRLVS